ncbi:VOC family protein [Tatumella ptyseos]|uniref:Predicted dioxygenase of extradiol dioxygenase family n=2 Tax=Tatumella ptyseos TaxID=82987 RepID=A0A2X5PET6_9GAMM|nr:VOC family protein [Tatumella ptyseos]KFD19144.1 putative ring-cleaving dioxygenase [Tatumella ptyseos ATCC 33301]SQK75322.1 Predicted dioxygenase of extradiol dioxygenase family [Tatumella ptyseos]
MKSVFHLAYHVNDLDESRQFYGDLLGCTEGRSTETWVDFDFFGHQISLHLGEPFKITLTGKVGDHWVPMPHLGLVLSLNEWQVIARKLQSAAIDFILPPQKRFAGEPGEQWIMFFQDPSGNPIEIKGFEDSSQLFAQ